MNTALKAKFQYLLLIAVFAVLSVTSIYAQDEMSDDPGHKENAQIAGVIFSCPNGFNQEKLVNSTVFMRHRKYRDLALFVAAPENQVDEQYLTTLSNNLATSLFAQEKNFKWKFSSIDSDGKVSRYQTGAGVTKGFNGKRFVQTSYFVIKIQNQELLVGYISQLGGKKEGESLFNEQGFTGMSMPGWYAQAHIIASITGEKYEEINPGRVITTTPPVIEN